MKALPLLLLLLTLGIAGCGDDNDNPLAPSDVMNRTWKLETIERAGSPSISVPNPEQYTLRMEDGGRLLIRADCNSCSGTYAMDGSALTISNLACTTAFCTLSSLDGNYAAALQSVRSVQVSGSLMTITGTGFTLRFRA